MVILVPARAFRIVKRIPYSEGRDVCSGHVALLLEPGWELTKRVGHDRVEEKGGERGVVVLCVDGVHCGEGVSAVVVEPGGTGLVRGSGLGSLLRGFTMP